jgi:hypothetical protein
MLQIDRATVTLLLTLAAATAPSAVAAQTAEEFYRGKVIKVIVPTGPGGTYALFGNIINERVSRYIPGNPALVMQFMPSGIQATNFLYNVPAKDGLTIGMLSQTAGMIQVLTPEHVKYDLRKFLALGLFSQLNAVLTVSERTAVQSVDELKTTPITLGATDTSSYQYVIPQMMNRYLGTKIKVITGYKGIAETTLAMERGEVDGVFLHRASMRPDLVESGLSVPIFQTFAIEPGLPVLERFVTHPREVALLNLLNAPQRLGLPLIAPPGLPEDITRLLRQSYVHMVASKDYLDEAARRAIDVGRPNTGEELADYVSKNLAAFPADTIREYRDYVERQ